MAEKVEGCYVPIAESLCRLRRVGFDKTTVRVRQVHAQIIEPHLFARNIAIRLTKVCLRVTRTMAQRHEHLTGTLRGLRYVLAHDCITAGEAFLSPQPLENPVRRVALLLVNRAVALQNFVNPSHERAELLGSGPFAPPVARRN